MPRLTISVVAPAGGCGARTQAITLRSNRETAVLLLVLQGLVINRLAGVEYPIWSPSKD